MSKRFPSRADVLAMLASYGDREPDEVSEELGSLELTWLVAQVEQRYSVLLDLDDDEFAAMSTVTGAVDRLRAVFGGSGPDPSTVDGQPNGGPNGAAGRAASHAAGGVADGAAGEVASRAAGSAAGEVTSTAASGAVGEVASRAAGEVASTAASGAAGEASRG